MVRPPCCRTLGTLASKSRLKRTTTSDAAIHSIPRRRTPRIVSRPRWITGSLLAGTALVATAVVQDEGYRTPVALTDGTPHAANKSPLQRLSVEYLSKHNDHLRRMSTLDLLRSYIVYSVCSQNWLVTLAPSVISALETSRELVPVLGPLLWQAYTYTMRKTFFAQFVAGESVHDCHPFMQDLHKRSVGTMLNWSAEASHTSMKPDEALSAKSFLSSGAVGELQRAIQAAADLHPDKTIKPSLLAIKVSGLIHDPASLERGSEALLSVTPATLDKTQGIIPGTPNLREWDVTALEELHEQLRDLCSRASSVGLRLVFDAEQSWLQPCIDRIVYLLELEYNKTRPVIYNTYQTNLTGTTHNLQTAIERAKRQDYAIGIKLVRGAYVDAENVRAAQQRRASPVWPTKEATDKCFDSCSDEVLARVKEDMKADTSKISVIYATHNIPSIRKSLETLAEQGLLRTRDADTYEVDHRVSGRVMYAQLLGMATPLSSTMQDLLRLEDTSMLPVNCLYVPYGQINLVLPYLLRRAQENKSVLQGQGQDNVSGPVAQRKAIGRELARRYFPMLA